jgi:predicted transcriptional regulator
MRAYAMSEAEIANELGMSKAAVKTILHRALTKIRAHPQLCARFRDAVEEQRRALDARWMSNIVSERIQ